MRTFVALELPGTFAVTLFKSTLSHDGATYKPLHRVELEGV